MARKTFYIFALLLFFFIAIGLSLWPKSNTTAPSFLIIAVDHLGYFDFNCSESKAGHLNNPAAALICPESLRFTHAYTTSPLSVPALSSILTGQYPISHKVLSNAQPGLDPKNYTIAEAALDLNYRTAFFSSGPPLLRKTGLHQGFEIFDDRLTFYSHTFFRPLSFMLSSFKDWFTHISKSQPFFAVIYTNELTYLTTQNFNESGKPMPLGYETQLKVFNHSLVRLFTFLKDNRRWDQTHIVLVGLNGRSLGYHPQETPALNLYGENTHITLLFKPAQKKRDFGRSWKTDQNVNLADIGKTIFEYLQESPKLPPQNEDFPIYSLKTLLSGEKPENNLPLSRPLLLQSDWANWQNIGNSRLAIIYDNYLYINNSPAKVYNTLIDNLESSPTPFDNTSAEFQNLIHHLNNKYDFKPFKLESQIPISFYLIPQKKWLLPEYESELIEELLWMNKSYPKNTVIHQWLSVFLVKNKNWTLLKKISQEPHFRNTRLLAEHRLKKNFKTNLEHFLSPECLNRINFKRMSAIELKKCEDKYLHAYLSYKYAKELNLDPESALLKLQQLYGQLLLEKQIQLQNLSSGQMWDTPTEASSMHLLQILQATSNLNIESLDKIEPAYPKPLEGEFIED